MSLRSLAAYGFVVAWLACSLGSASGLAADAIPKAKSPVAKPAAEKPQKENPEKPNAEPHGKPHAKGSAAGKQDPSTVAIPPLPDPVVEAILATNPSTPEELLRAAKILASVKPELARKYLGRLIETKLSDAEWAALSEKFGQGVVLQLADQKDLLPEGRQLADRILKSTAQHARDPQQLMTLTKQLGAASSEARREAAVGLEKGGSAGAASLLAVLADPQRAPEYALARLALAQLGTAATGPLMAALDSSDRSLVVQTVRTLALLKDSDSRLLLAAPLYASDSPAEVREAASAAVERHGDGGPDREKLIELLVNRAREYAAQRVPFSGAVDGKIEVWRWDAAGKLAVSAVVPVDDAARRYAARFARDAHRLAPKARSASVLFLATMLEAASYTAGLDNALPAGPGTAADEAAQFELDTLQAALTEANRMGHWAGAKALVRILASKGSARQLLYQTNQPSALVQAARQPDRRLRMAAVDAVVELKPNQPFAGSSYVVDALAFLASSGGRRCVIVGGPKSEDAMRFAGGLTEEGYAIDVATSGQEFLRMAYHSPDYEFALIDVGIDQPTADVVVQRLRQDCRTALMPVGLIARDGFLERAEHIASTESLTKAFPRPHSAASVQWEAAQLRSLAVRQWVPFEVRQKQAKRALEHLAVLSKSVDSYDQRRIEAAAMSALASPQLTLPAVSVIGNIGTPESQRALVELASRPSIRLEVRQAASKAFLENTWRFGILLSRPEIARQYDRYNNSEKQDPATQRILGLILDSLEMRAENNKLGVAPGGGGVKPSATQGSRP